MQVAAFGGSQVNVLSHSSSPMVAVRFTISGGVLGVSEDGAMTMWSSDTGQRLWNISFAGTPRKYDYTSIKIRAMDVSADGRLAAVAYLRSGVDRSSIDPKAEDAVKRKDTVWETHLVLIDTSNGAIKKDFDTLRDASVTTLLLAASGKYVFVTGRARFGALEALQGSSSIG